MMIVCTHTLFRCSKITLGACTKSIQIQTQFWMFFDPVPIQKKRIFPVIFLREVWLRSYLRCEIHKERCCGRFTLDLPRKVCDAALRGDGGSLPSRYVQIASRSVNPIGILTALGELKCWASQSSCPAKVHANIPKSQFNKMSTTPASSLVGSHESWVSCPMWSPRGDTTAARIPPVLFSFHHCKPSGLSKALAPFGSGS